MRTVLIAAVALAGAGAADAQQRIVAQGPAEAPSISYPAMPYPAMQAAGMDDGAVARGPGGSLRGPNVGGPDRRPADLDRGPPPHGRHWGGRDHGHWIGGMRAPGGWEGYHRPERGYGLPDYWRASTFQIGDWSDYGLYQPPVGYGWSRYYDDAVLIDGNGAVYDTVGGIDWPRYDLDEAQGGRMDAYNANTDEYRATAGASYPYPPRDGYAQPPAYAQRGQAPVYYGPPGAPQRRGNGVGGALIGGAAGGVAGGLIAGRHDKVAGALIGAGAGALAGYAIDRSHRRAYAPADAPGAGYPPPPEMYGPGPGYPPPMRVAPPTVIDGGAGSIVTTSSVGGAIGGTYVNGYYYPSSTITTVTVANAPVVTTTTVFEDSVTYTHHAARRTYRKHVWHRPACYCVAR